MVTKHKSSGTILTGPSCKSVKLQKPAWDAHISVVSGEVPPRMELWKTWEGQEYEFTYDPQLKDNGEYYWLDVDCPPLLDIREALGLARQPFFPLHLTVGRITDS